MAEKLKDHIVVLEPCTASVTTLLQELRKRENVEILMTNSVDEAVQLVNQFTPCVVIGNIQESSALASTINLLKRIESGIKYGLLKTMIVSRVKSHQLSSLITGLGVTDYIEEPIVARTMLFKANIQLKALETIRKKEEAKKASKEKIVLKKGEEGKQGGETPIDLPPGKRPALELADDCFLFKNNGVKKTGKKITVEVEGPPPESGEWAPQEAKPDGQSSWRWVPTDEEGQPLPGTEQEGWVYDGEKPQFKDGANKWQLQGEKPDLSFYKGKTKIASKLTTKEDGTIEIAEDSPEAEANILKQKKRIEKRKEKELIAKNKAAEKVAENAAATTLANDTPSEEAAVKQRKKKSLKDITDKLQAGQISAAPENEGELQPSITAPENEMPEATILKQKNKPSKPNKEESITSKETAASETTIAEPNTASTLEKKESAALNFLKKKKSQLSEKSLASAADIKADESPSSELKKATVHEEDTDATQKQDISSKLGDTTEESFDSKIESEPESPSIGQKKRKISLKDKPKSNLDPLAPTTSTEGAETENTVSEIPATEEEKKSLKKKLLLDIQKELNKPLQELSNAELEETARAHGLDLNTTPKSEIAKKRRLDKLKNLKDKLQAVDAPKEAATSSTNERDKNTHDLSNDEPENTLSLNGEANIAKEKSKLNAIDSEEIPESNEENKTLGKLTSDTPRKRPKKPGAKYFYRTEREIPAADRAWEHTGSHYVCISAQIRYRGFESIEALLPLWIYSGSEVPEFEDKENRWCFLDQDARKCAVTKDIPFEVIDFLNAINRQVKNDSAKSSAKEKVTRLDKNKEEQNGVEPSATNQRKEARSSEENTENAERDTTAQDLSTEAVSEETEEFATKKKGTQLDKENEEISERDITAQDLSTEAVSETDVASLEEKSRKANGSTDEEEIASSKSRSFSDEDEKNELASETESNSTTSLDPEKNGENQKNTLDNVELDSTEAKKKAQQETAALTASAPPRRISKSLDDLSTKSDKIKKFLEERKEKQRPNEAKPQLEKQEPIALKGFLGLSVAVSDAIYDRKNIRESGNKICELLGENMGRCFAYLTEKDQEGKQCILGSNNPELPKGSAYPEEISVNGNVSNKIIQEVKFGTAEKSESLGYLILEAQAKRDPFNESETLSLKRLAEMISSYWSAKEFPKSEMPERKVA